MQYDANEAAEFFAATAAGNTRVARTVAKLVQVMKEAVIQANVKSLSGKNATAARALFAVALKQGVTLPAGVSEEDAQKISDETKRLDGRALKSVSVILRGSSLFAWHDSYVTVVNATHVKGCKTAGDLLDKLDTQGDGAMIQFDITAPEGKILAPLMHARAPSRTIGNMAYVYVSPNSKVTLASSGGKPAVNKPSAKPSVKDVKPAVNTGKPAANIKPSTISEPTSVDVSDAIKKAVLDSVKRLRSMADDYPDKFAVTGETLCAKKDDNTDVKLLLAAVALQTNAAGFLMVLKKRCGVQRYSRLEKFIAALSAAKVTGMRTYQRRTTPDINFIVIVDKGFKVTF